MSTSTHEPAAPAATPGAPAGRGAPRDGHAHLGPAGGPPRRGRRLPAVALGAVIAGGSLYGAIGGFLALPAAAILQAGLSTYLTRHEVMDSELTRVHAR